MDMTRVGQALVNGIIDGSVIGALAASLALVLSVTQRFHVAYVSTYVGGVYAAIWSQQTFGWALAPAVVFGLACATVFGVLLEAGVYRPISDRAAGRGHDPLIPVFVASLGITIVVQNLIAFHFNTQPISFSLQTPAAVNLGPIVITSFTIWTTVLSWVMLVALAAFLNFTRRGRWMKGVRVNPEMAAAVGINTRRVYLAAFAIASLYAGLFGMFESTNVAATPDMGFDLMFLGFVVAFVAGPLSSPLTIGLIGVFFGEASSITQLWLSPVWGTIVVFSILMAYLVGLSLRTRVPWLRFLPAAS